MNHYLLILEDEASIEDMPSEFEVYPIEPHILLIAANIDDIQAMKVILGIAENQKAGAVLKLNGSYSGYYYRELWDWLRKTRELPVDAIA